MSARKEAYWSWAFVYPFPKSERNDFQLLQDVKEYIEIYRRFTQNHLNELDDLDDLNELNDLYSSQSIACWLSVFAMRDADLDTLLAEFKKQIRIFDRVIYYLRYELICDRRPGS